MRLEGRLTGHFLARVAMLLAGLGLLFMMWIGGLVFSAWQANRTATPPTDVLRRASADTTVTADGVVRLSASTVDTVRSSGFWMQVLDERGDEVTQTGRPARVPRHYTAGGLVLYHEDPARLGQSHVFTWVERVGGRELTFVLGQEGPAPQGPSVLLARSANSPSQSTLWMLMIGLLAGGAAVTLGVAWLFGRGLSRPLVHMMAWLSGLARGDLAEPLGPQGRPASRGPLGERIRPYATYREVFDALDSLTARLKTTEEERARLESAREEWIAGVTHDLRTPLTSIQGYADVLASDYEFAPDDVRRQAGVIAGQASHMDSLLDDLNLSFRLRADAVRLRRASVDLIELGRETAVDLANDPRAAGRIVRFDDPPGRGSIRVEADAALLARAVRNVLVNAAVHNPAGTTVSVTVTREGPTAVVSVADDGIGMDEATRARLFDRYYRGTSTAAGAEGSGLGMAIARQIVEAHGGRVEVATAPGQGTTVRLAVPASA